jgi:hypothetical protein
MLVTTVVYCGIRIFVVVANPNKYDIKESMSATTVLEFMAARKLVVLRFAIFGFGRGVVSGSFIYVLYDDDREFNLVTIVCILVYTLLGIGVEIEERFVAQVV